MSSYLRSSIHTALLATALAGSGVASAAEPQQTTFIEEIEVIVVTGSYIEGAAEDAALPIDVLRAEDLAKQGSPSMVELIKTIPAVQGVVGESNQYTAGGTTGTANINLRGLGGGRTLVLMNGRRLAPSTVGVIGYDVNLLPMAAIGRIEILKDGAAATYGSDAVAGVVNFITKQGFEGMSLEASYNYVEDSDGDYTANAVFGHKGESWDMLIAGGYRKRSELSALDRDFVSQNSADNPQGGFSGAANPGTFIFPTGVAASPIATVRDPGCAAGLGAPSATGACLYQFTAFNNLVEEEEHYQAYTEFNVQLGETTEFHIDALYAAHDVPGELASASYGPQQGATLGAGGRLSAPNFTVPKTNPGFAALLPAFQASLASNPALLAAFNASPNLTVSGTAWRPFASGGNPLTGGAKEDERLFEGIRLSTSVNGELSGINWDVGVTYGENSSEINTYDIITTRLAAALQGFGGPNCTSAAAAGQNGCLWLNPFSTAVQRNSATGVVNPGFDPNVANTAELANWLFASNGYEDKSTTLVGEVVLNSQLPFNLGAGEIGWAAGLQYRKEGLERDPNDLTDSSLNPCVTSVGTVISTPSNGCLTPAGTQSGVFTFFGPIAPQDLDRNVKAVFGELNVPILESLSAQVAVRYETYGGNVGSTTNPKLSLRWQALDWLGLRGSAGTTFRGPLQTQLLNTNNTALAFVPAAGAFRTFDNAGNPNLKPEEAFTFNVGMIIKAGNFATTLDYWSYDFTDSLENESGTEMVAAFFGTTSTSPNQCGNPAFAGLQGRFTFQNGVCSIANLIRVQTNVINGPDQKISGLDLGMSYLFEDTLGGDLLIGGDGTYTLEYERDAAIVEGVQIQPAADYIGTRGASGIGAGTLPELRGSVYIDYSTNWLAPQGIRITSRYIDGVTDVRAGLGATTQRGVEIGSFLTHDLVYRLSLPSETTITASVINIADRDPPFARLELSYDPFIANPLGRYYKLLLNKKF